MTLRIRYLRLKWYLHVYNSHLRCSDWERSKKVIAWLNYMWDRFSWAERQFILRREGW